MTSPRGRVALVLSDSFSGPEHRRCVGSSSPGTPTRAATVRAVALHRVTGGLRGRGAPDGGGRRPRRRGPVRLGSLDAEGRPGPHAEVDPTVLARRAARSAFLPTDPARLARLEPWRRRRPLGTLCTQTLGEDRDDARFVAEKRGRFHPAPCVGAARCRGTGATGPVARLPRRGRRAVHGARPRKRESFERALEVCSGSPPGAGSSPPWTPRATSPWTRCTCSTRPRGPAGPRARRGTCWRSSTPRPPAPGTGCTTRGAT